MQATAAIQSRRARVDWIDAGRGLAILLVVLFHATNWLAAAGADVEGWMAANLVISSLRMPLFFTLSGLFAAKWVNGAFSALWETKLRLYLWVFLLWGLIGSFTYFIGLRMKDEGSLLQILVRYLESPVVPRLELWFIWALALFFVVAKATSRVPTAIQLVVAGAASAVALSGWDTITPGWSGSVKYYVFFLVGLHLRQQVLALGEHPSRWLQVAVVAVWAVVSLALWELGWREVPGLYFVNCVLGVLAGVAIARMLATLPWLRAIGSQTLPIYLAHTPIVILLAAVLHSFGVPGRDPVDLILPPVLVAIAVWLAVRLRDGLERVGAGWVYAAPAWFGRVRSTRSRVRPLPVPGRPDGNPGQVE